MISSKLLLLKMQRISSQCQRMRCLGALLYRASTSSMAYFGSMWRASSDLRSRKTRGRSAFMMQQFAMPALQTSYPLRLMPVRPRQQPILFLSRDRKQAPHTSVKKPIWDSTIAKVVFSVAILYGEKMLRPTPLPITQPSQFEIWRLFILVSLQSRVNSFLKKSSSNFLSFYRALQSCLTSAPTLKAFSPAPSSQKALVLLRPGSASQIS